MTLSIEINGVIFQTKRQLREKMQQLAARYMNSRLPPEKVNFCVDFINKLHIRARQKIGEGIAAIEVRLNDYKKPGFYLFRVGETNERGTDFTWKKCVDCFDFKTGKPDTRKWHTSDVKQAFRHEVNDQIAKAKGGRGNPKWQTHHAGDDFNSIYKRFLRNYHLDPMTIELTGYQDHSENKSLKDRTLAEKWKKYHAENSRLIRVSKEEHDGRHKHKNGKEPGFIPPKRWQTKLFPERNGDEENDRDTPNKG